MEMTLIKKLKKSHFYDYKTKRALMNKKMNTVDKLKGIDRIKVVRNEIPSACGIK